VGQPDASLPACVRAPHVAHSTSVFVPRVGADQTAAVCGRLLRALLKLDRFIKPHDQVYCLCAQQVRVSTSELLRLMREIQVPMVLLKVGLQRPHRPRVARNYCTDHAWHLSAEGTRSQPRVAPAGHMVPRVASIAHALHLPRVAHSPGVRSEAQVRHDDGGAQLGGCCPAGKPNERIASDGHWHLRVRSFWRGHTRQRKKSGHLLQSTVRPCFYAHAWYMHAHAHAHWQPCTPIPKPGASATRGHTPHAPPARATRG